MHPKLLNKVNKAAKSQQMMISELNNPDPELLIFKPDVNSWNILEVVEHCKNVDALTFTYLKKYQDYPSRPAGIKENIRGILLKLALKGGFKFKVPNKSLLPEGKFSPQELAEKWIAIRMEIIKFLETFPEEKLNHAIFKHPRAGYITIVQTIDFINDHTIHHRNQISRIKETYGKKGY